METDRTRLDRLRGATFLVAIAAFVLAMLSLIRDAYTVTLVAVAVGAVALLLAHVARWADRRDPPLLP